MTSPGTVFLVGAGPGDPGLITVAGLDVLRRADVVACDRLIGPELLCEVRPNAEVVHVGKAPGLHTMTQAKIGELLVDRARAGKLVVRLKGGDPFVFGRGFEELCACREAGIPCVVIPGVSSAIAGPAAAGIPVTDRRHVRAFAVITGHESKDGDPTPINDAALAGIDTLVILMGRETLADMMSRLIRAGRNPQTPVACIERATTPAQRVCTGTLATIVDTVEQLGLTNPMITVVGEVAKFAVDDTAGRDQRPLAGRRILITRPRTRRDALRERLHAGGAVTISCPLIHFALSDPGPLDRALRAVGEYQWIVFTSQQSVTAFWCRFGLLGRDARSLAPCKIAAVGPATSNALQCVGISADLVPKAHTADSLADELAARCNDQRGRILLPRSDIAPEALPDQLRALGFQVDALVAYKTMTKDPPPALRQRLAAGIDAITFCSPSAVRAFVAARLDPGGTVIACIGPPTAEAAKAADLIPTVVAAKHTGPGLAAALSDYFAEHSHRGKSVG